VLPCVDGDFDRSTYTWHWQAKLLRSDLSRLFLGWVILSPWMGVASSVELRRDSNEDSRPPTSSFGGNSHRPRMGGYEVAWLPNKASQASGLIGNR
jgi:hypothetical protein